MDYLESNRFIGRLGLGLPTDMNVYDAASLSAVIELSQWSVANGSRPVDFLDIASRKKEELAVAERCYCPEFLR